MFRFKQFGVIQRDPVFKIGTDSTLLGALAPLQQPKRALEIGSGAGIISMMIAQRSPSTSIDAIDILKEAADLSNENFENSPFKNRLKAFHSPLADFRPSDSYDLIFSNPPFFQNSLLGPNQAKNQARHTIELSFESIFEFASENLGSKGQLSLIVPAENLEEFKSLSGRFGFKSYSALLIQNKATKPYKRLIYNAFRQAEISIFPYPFELNPSNEGHFTLRNSDDSFTQEYLEITKDFHPFI